MYDAIPHLDPATARDLDDLADARGRLPRDLVEEAVRGYLRAETERVRSVGERLAVAHADLLRRLGE
ncbi:hypothetical protein ACFV0T_06500 [Streptomyces sp. NPDC059582]|uniref:hypothetical protein n=1 Tax=Streptomyces sp. NPDC059582 TaxID=3346875 RepID=UPI00368456AF